MVTRKEKPELKAKFLAENYTDILNARLMKNLVIMIDNKRVQLQRKRTICKR